MKAPGEAEAAAAALNACGLVDAVQSPDGDALLFGARMLFHTLKLAVSDIRLSYAPSAPRLTGLTDSDEMFRNTTFQDSSMMV